MSAAKAKWALMACLALGHDMVPPQEQGRRELYIINIAYQTVSPACGGN